METSPSEAAQVNAIGHGAFSEDADWTPVQVRLLDEPLPLHQLIDGLVEPLFARVAINVDRVQASDVEVTDGLMLHHMTWGERWWRQTAHPD